MELCLGKVAGAGEAHERTGMKKKWPKIARWGVSLLFLVFLFGTIQKGEFLHLFEDMRPQFVLASFGISALMILTSCAKWQLLLDLQGIHLSFAYLLKIYLIGYYFSNLLPSAVGGDVVRSYYTGAKAGCQTRAAVAVFLERVTGILFLLILAAAAPLFEIRLYRHPAVLLPALISIGILLALAGLWWFGMSRIMAFLGRFKRLPRRGWTGRSPLCQRLTKVVVGFHRRLSLASQALRTDRKRFAVVFLLTALFYGLTWLNVYSAFLVFGAPPGFTSMCAVIPAIMLVFLLPISAGNIGLAEGAYVYYFRMLGIHPEFSLAMSLFIRFKLIVIGVIGFLLYMRGEGMGCPATEELTVAAK